MNCELQKNYDQQPAGQHLLIDSIAQQAEAEWTLLLTVPVHSSSGGYTFLL